MKLITNIYIDTALFTDEEPVYERLELFDFESIEITSSIQNVRDIGSIFTDFTQQFTIPASKTNNRILKHFYNLYLTNGYDARVKRLGFININGIPFRNGYIRLSEANIRNGKPFSYSITFFGAIVNLKDILGDDELKDLSSLGEYDHDYTLDKVHSGFKVGLGLNPNFGQQGQEDKVIESTDADLIYPAISADDKWSYNSNGASAPEPYEQGFNVNIYGTTPAYGISFTQLKPALKVKKVLEAIETKYESITFSNDFFSNTDFNQLYLLLHAKKGVLADSDSGLTEELSLDLSLLNFSKSNQSGVNNNILPITTWTRNRFGKNYTKTCFISVGIRAITTSGSGNYNVKVYNGLNDLLLEGNYSGVGGTEFLTTTLSSQEEKIWDIKIVISSGSELNQFELTANLTDEEEYLDEDYYDDPVVRSNISSALYTSKITTLFENVIINKQVPKIKVIDFLKGLFNAFNLTAYVVDGVIVVKTLDEFYKDGVDRDLTKLLDISDSTVKRAELFSNINFEFQKPTTFGVINQNEVAQDDFGNLQFQGTVNGKNGNLVFDGGSYDIKLPFEKMLYERLSDEKDLSLPRVPFGYGWLVNKDEAPTITKPVLFFNINTPVNSTDYPINFIGINGSVTKYNRPSNSSFTEESSLNFGEEIDEFTSNSVTSSLFNNNYKNYISNLFANTSRIVNYTCIFNLNTLLRYEMNDRVIINGNPYRFNEIKTNLSTGKSEVELITDFEPIDAQAPTVPTNLAFVSATDNSITISWTASTDNVGVSGYEIYVDGSLVLFVGNVTIATIGSLSPNTSYSIEVLAIDEAGNSSAKTSPLSADTLVADNTIPVFPPNPLQFGSRQGSQVIFRFSQATDSGTGVEGYYIWLNQNLLQEDITPPYTIVSGKVQYLLDGVPLQQTSTLNVQAFDFAGNVSALSNTITIPSN